MSENSGENETYNDYSVDDEDQPQGDGDSLVSDRGLDEPLDEGYSPPEKWSRRRGLRQHARYEEEIGETLDQRIAQEEPEPDPYAEAAAARPRTSAARSAPRAPAGWSTRTRASAPTWRRTWSARTSASTAPARAPRRPPSTSSTTRSDLRRAAGRSRSRGQARRSWWTPRSPASVSRASSAACASSSARRVASSSSRVAVVRPRAAETRSAAPPLEPLQRAAGEDLLLGGGPLRAAAAEEATRPVQQRGDPVLEAGQVDEVHRQPHQPGDERRSAAACRPARPPGTG